MFWFGRSIGGAAGLSELFDRPPRGDRWTMWIGGVVFAVLLGVLALYLWLASSKPALAFFLAAWGAMLHFHYCWGLHPKLQPLSQLGKNIAAAGMIAPLLYGLYRFLVS